GHVANRVDMDQHAHAGDEEQPDGGERVEEKAEVGVERSGGAVFFEEGEMGIAGAEPCVNDFLERLTGAVGKVRVLDDGEAGEQERDHDGAHADGVDGGLLEAAAKEEHHRGPEGREERNQPDVVKEHVVRRWSLVVRYSLFVIRCWPFRSSPLARNSRLEARSHLPLQQIDLIYVDRLFVSEEGDQNS